MFSLTRDTLIARAMDTDNFTAARVAINAALFAKGAYVETGAFSVAGVRFDDLHAALDYANTTPGFTVNQHVNFGPFESCVAVVSPLTRPGAHA